MSADLFAAFGSPEPKQPATKQPPNNSGSQVILQASNNLKESPWILQSQPIPENSRQDKNEPLWKIDSTGADVLFDASDTEDADDFGDFEAASPQTSKQILPEHQHSHNDNVDLLGLDDFSEPSFVQPERIEQPSNDRDLVNKITEFSQSSHQSRSERQEAPIVDDDDWGDFEDVGQASHGRHPPVIKNKPLHLEHRKPNTSFENDEWEVFVDAPPNPPTSESKPLQSSKAMTKPIPQPQSTLHLPKSSPASHIPQTTSKPTLSEQRPTNIPPPSTLLQLLPQIYRNLSTQSRDSDPPSTLAHQTLQIYVTTAHIIAGRSSRWKRDTILSQSTRISQAGVKHTGMKLTALDKSESIKEEQEAQEAIAAWQRHAATLNAIMLKAKLQKPPMSLSANMAARATSGPAVLTAKECCAVCGLNRNERVMGIDVKVEDTFGEFWVEHWGHRDCREFWYTYEGLLNKR